MLLPTIPPTYISFFIIHVYMEEDLCRGVVYFTVMFDHPSCFPTFCPSGIPTSCYIFNIIILTSNPAIAEDVTECRDTRMAKVKKQGRDDHTKQRSIHHPLQRSFSIYLYNEER